MKEKTDGKTQEGSFVIVDILRAVEVAKGERRLQRKLCPVSCWWMGLLVTTLMHLPFDLESLPRWLVDVLNKNKLTPHW